MIEKQTCFPPHHFFDIGTSFSAMLFYKWGGDIKVNLKICVCMCIYIYIYIYIYYESVGRQ